MLQRPHHRPANHLRAQQAGFSLVELLVAMLIGLITVVVVAQVMLMTESRKRTATSGSDANVTDSMALFTIERDARNAGFGMGGAAALGCPIRAKFGNNTTITYTLAPVIITQGDSGAPDTISFAASAKDGVPLPVTVTVDHPQTATNFFVQSDLGINQGDIMIAVPPPGSTDWCSVFQVTNDTSTGGSGGGGQGQNQVLHTAGLSPWNQAGGQTIFPDAGYPQGSTLINMGAMSMRAYSIANNSLRLTWLDTTDGTNKTRDLYPDVIQLQAEYGLDDLSTPAIQITSWTTTTPTTPAQWQAVKAIRLAVVARSNVYEKTVVTHAGSGSTFSECRASHPRAVCWAGGPINQLNANNPGTDDWQHYRYRVYENVIPLRNVIWQQ